MIVIVSSTRSSINIGVMDESLSIHGIVPGVEVGPPLNRGWDLASMRLKLSSDSESRMILWEACKR